MSFIFWKFFWEKIYIGNPIFSCPYRPYFRGQTKRYSGDGGSSYLYNIFDFIFTWNAFLGDWLFSSILPRRLWHFSRFVKNLSLYPKSHKLLKIGFYNLWNWKNGRFYFIRAQLDSFSISSLSTKSHLCCSLS